MAADRSRWPFLVWLGLWGLSTRASAWSFFWFSLACAVAAIPLGLFVHPFCFAGTLFVVAALWYYLSIHWVDRNGNWT